MVMFALFGKTDGGSPKPFHAAFTISEFSPKFGARNEVPQPPLKVRSSIGDQLKPIFVLLVPPKSLYWSWRQDASRSSLWKKGIAFMSLKTGMLICANPAQIARDCGSVWMLTVVLFGSWVGLVTI